MMSEAKAGIDRETVDQSQISAVKTINMVSPPTLIPTKRPMA